MTRPEKLGTALRATISAVRSIVTALHTGELHSDLTSKGAKHAYWTPSFQQGRAPESSDSTPYSALLISLMLGNASPSRKAHPTVKLALLILELHEVGALTNKDLEDIYAGNDGFTMELLQTVLLKTRDAHFSIEAQREAVEILSAV